MRQVRRLVALAFILVVVPMLMAAGLLPKIWSS